MIQINKYSSLVKLMILFMISTLSQTLWPISSPNRIIGFLVFLNILWIYCDRLDRWKFTAILLACLLVFGTFFVADDFSRNFSDCIYWMTTILFLLEARVENFIYDINDSIEYNRKWIVFALITCNLLIIVGMFDSRCYGSEAWGGGYFIGYTSAAHTLCSGCCIMLVLTLLVLKGRNDTTVFSVAYLIPGTIAILQSGARVFLVPVLVVFILFYIYCLRSVSIKFVLAPFAVIIGIYVILNSGFMTKITSVSENVYMGETLLTRLTSGRTVFWLIDINAYSELDIFGKLFGNGFDYVYYINSTRYGLDIWAHNDVIDCLLSVGIVGTVLYLCVFIRCLSGLNYINGRRKILTLLIMVYLTIPMLLNGLFEYQHYLYSAVLLMTFGVNEEVPNSLENDMYIEE